MVSAPLNQSWIGRDMIVTSSPDAALVGRCGLVVDETRAVSYTHLTLPTICSV